MPPGPKSGASYRWILVEDFEEEARGLDDAQRLALLGTAARESEMNGRHPWPSASSEEFTVLARRLLARGEAGAPDGARLVRRYVLDG